MGLIAGVHGMENGITFSCWDSNPKSSSPLSSYYTDSGMLIPVYQSCTLQKLTVFHSIADSQEFDEKTLGPIVFGQHTLFLSHDRMKAMAFGKCRIGFQDLL